MSFFEQQEQRKDKQFISIFDSVSFVSEYGKGTVQQSFDFIVGTLLRKQTYLLLITPTTVKVVHVCSSYEQSACEPYITFESIIHELKMCLDRNIVGTGNPIYKLGFGKKRFVEQLLNLGMQIPEEIVFNTESPDITHAEIENDSDELAFYQGLPKEYDILRAENEKIKAQYQELFNKKGQPEAFYNIQKQLYESSREQLDECKNKLDKLLVNYKNLESDYDYCKRNFESTKKKTALTQQIAEKRISELENKLAQAEAKLADKPADDDKELNTKSQNYAAKIVLAMAQIADLSLDSPYASKEPNTTNSIIFDQIKINGMKVSNQVIGNWLKLATEQTKDD